MLLETLVAGSLVVSLLTQETERTVAVEAGTRLEVTNFAGEIVISGWDRDEVHMVAQHGSRDVIDVHNRGAVLDIQADTQRKVPPIVDYRLQIPKWMALNLIGPHSDMFIQGVDGNIQAETVEGTIDIRGGAGSVTLRSVEGDVALRDADGRIEVFNINSSIHIQDCEGQILAETTEGDIILQNVDVGKIDASTLDGDMLFVGSLADEGVYRFASHEGDLIITLPDNPNASISVALYEGEFESDFALELGERPGEHDHHKKKARRFRFTLGSGSAQMELETFEGDIWLRNRRNSGSRSN